MNKSKLFLAGMLAMTLVFGLVLTGCPTEPEEEKDTWSAVTKLDQLNGTWKGSYSETMLMKEMMGDLWDADMQTMFGDMKVAISADMTITINASDKTATSSGTTTMAFSGGNINSPGVWDAIKSFLESGSYPDAEVNNEKKSITMLIDEETEQLDDEDIAEMQNSGLQINQNGKKIKYPAGTMNGVNTPELILTKQ